MYNTHQNFIKLSYAKSLNLLDFIISNNLKTECTPSKNRIDILNTLGEIQARFMLPLIINITESLAAIDFVKVREKQPDYIIFLVQAGNAALGCFENFEMIEHKVIRKYMTRKKQGKAQITYLKKKGKSRAGSRIRLNDSVAFFKEINEKLNEWVADKTIDTFIYTCTPLLWGMLFATKPAPPFDRKSSLLKKLPLDLSAPNMKQLEIAAAYVKYGFLNMGAGEGKLTDQLKRIVAG